MDIVVVSVVVVVVVVVVMVNSKNNALHTFKMRLVFENLFTPTTICVPWKGYYDCVHPCALTSA